MERSLLTRSPSAPMSRPLERREPSERVTVAVSISCTNMSNRYHDEVKNRLPLTRLLIQEEFEVACNCWMLGDISSLAHYEDPDGRKSLLLSNSARQDIKTGAI